MAQTALITGASGGIGLDLAREFARHGYNLVLVARSADKLAAAADELRRNSVQVEVIAQDLSESASAQPLANVLEQRGITIDILVNNAGFGLRGAFANLPADEQVNMIDLNVTSLVALTRTFLPGMIARRRGRILNVASTAAFQPGPFMAVYYATKSFVVSFSEALGEELRHTGVTVTTLCPGPTHTGFADRAGMAKVNLFKKRAVMSSADVARAGYEGCVTGKRIVIPGGVNRLGAFAVRFMPKGPLLRMIRGMNSESD
jgi:uncharacterized protein